MHIRVLYFSLFDTQDFVCVWTGLNRGMLFTNKFIKQDYQLSQLRSIFCSFLVDTTTLWAKYNILLGQMLTWPIHMYLIPLLHVITEVFQFDFPITTQNTMSPISKECPHLNVICYYLNFFVEVYVCSLPFLLFSFELSF